MNKRFLTAACLMALGSNACGGKSTNNVSEGVLVASLAQPSGTVDNTIQTTLWLSQKEGGTCVVLPSDTKARINGVAARLVSSGEAPGWIATKFNRYAGCSWPMFQLEAVPPVEGAKIEVQMGEGAEMATATFTFSGGAWLASQCAGVTSCCTGSVSGLALMCIDAM